MRSLFTRLALVGIAGVAITGCGSQGSPYSVGNASGGGTVPFVNQSASAGTVQDVLIDNGIVTSTNMFSGSNNTATDTQSANDAGNDPSVEAGIPVAEDPTPNPSASPAATAAPVGSHSITFTGSGAPQVVFKSSAEIPNLSYTSPLLGDSLPTDFGAIVLYAHLTAAATAPASGTPSIAIELTGGSNATAYDVRSTCGALAAKGATPTGGLTRYVCVLPAYGATSGTSGSTTLKAAVAATSTTAATAAVTSSYIVDADFANPRTPDTTGQFTPIAPTLYVELIYGSPTSSASTGNVLNLDYIYAEAGAK